MFNLLDELNKQANYICDELLGAKRAAKKEKGKAAAYQQGRAEELAKWLESVESLISKLTEQRENSREGTKEKGGKGEK